MRKKIVEFVIQKEKGAYWELNPGPLTVLRWRGLRSRTITQSENHTTRPHAPSCSKPKMLVVTFHRVYIEF